MTLNFPKELILGGDEWKIQPFRFDVHAINTGSYTPSYRDVTVTGYSPLNLPNAEANGLRYIKLFGKCEQAPNLFDKDKATLNYYINSSGEEQANASWACSDYIEVTVGKPYNLSGVSSYGSSPRTGFYAANKSFVSSRSQSSANFTIPDGVKYMRVSIYKASIDTAVVKQVLSMDNPIPILCNNGEVGSTGFTVVGSPTISSDLVVSGFSSGNYIQAPSLSKLLGNADNWEMDYEFTTPNDVSTNVGVLCEGNTNWCNLIRIGKTNHPTILQVSLSSTGSSYDIASYKDITYVTANTTYYLKLIFTGTEYLCQYSIDGINYTTVNIATTSTKIKDNSTALNIGVNKFGSSNDPFRGTIDLKGFKLTVDGVPVRLTETVSLNDQTAVARDLLSCGEDYVDEQNITTGEIVRKVGYKIFDGTENWSTYSGTPASGYAYRIVNNHLQENTYLPFCTHFKAVRGNLAVSSMKIGDFKCLSSGDTMFFISDYSTLDDWKNYLAAQYSAGTPVIAVYPLATPTTETVAAQDTLQNVEGLNTLYITQSAIDGLSMEVTYSAGVEVTIEAVQNANVDQQVEVTIGE